MKEIILSKHKVSFVDDNDYDELNTYLWHFEHGYAARTEYINGKKTKVYMHVQIMNPPLGKEVDHINNNRSDNRRENLRICNKKQNGSNVGIKKNNKSGYIGVSWDKRCEMWSADISPRGKHILIGHYSNIIDAAKAYDKKAKEYFGEFAKLNFSRGE